MCYILKISFEDQSGVRCVSLADCGVSSIETYPILCDRYPLISELDLGSNLLNSWSQIFTVLDNLKNIKILNLR